jgi:hypothetical protein
MDEDGNELHAPPPPVAPASFPDQDAQVSTPMDAASPQCPVCGRDFHRPQERNRHVQTYLPHWILCPFEGCVWRGNREYDLKVHWLIHAADKDPQLEDCIIYNPDPLVQAVLNRESTMEQAIAIALQAVRIRAQEPDKAGIWENEWGRRQKSLH